MIVTSGFFDQEPLSLARSLVGKVLRHRIEHPVMGSIWLAAQIIETEAYSIEERGSHSSLGFTEKRRAMFMAPGTIYMYYARGGDSLNFSARGEGNGVLVKSGIPFTDKKSGAAALALMHQLNPVNGRPRKTHRLCSGQTLLCRALSLNVPDWDQRQLARNTLVLEDLGGPPKKLVQCRRLGIPAGRDEHLPYRFVDYDQVKSATANPLRSAHRIITQR